MIHHHFTVDVEEYFQVSAFESVVRREHWADYPSRVCASTRAIVDLLRQYRSGGTFFVLGHVARQHPGMVREIAAEGHEVASHGWDHRKVTDQTPDEFRESVRRTKAFLEDLVGQPVLGFRAPSFSIVRGREWALDILAEEGYTYDSSLFPIHRPGYGYAAARRDPHWLEVASGRLRQFPPTTLRRFGANLPAAGGAYFRIFPYQLVRSGFRDCERRGVPGTFYIHPWEIDPQQPRLSAPASTRFRHYTGLARTLPRLHRLLSEFRFASIARQMERMDRPEAA